MKTRDRIVFLDAGTVNYGDISFDAFKRLGEYREYARTTPAQIEKRVRGASIVLTNKCPFDARLLVKLPELRLIALSATGTNNVDIAAARRLGIAVANVAGYSTESVAQWTIGFLLALAGNLVKHNATAHADWTHSPFFVYAPYPIREVGGKTLGIVGYGAIGRRVARLARAFGMRVLVAAIPGRRYARSAGARTGFAETLRRSDYVTLHAPLSPLTEKIIDARAIAKMKKGAFLINTARGGLVDERALFAALRSGKLAGAASDVLSVEPPPANHPLLRAPNLILSPHVAWASREVRERLVREMALNIRAFQQGKRRNRVA